MSLAAALQSQALRREGALSRILKGGNGHLLEAVGGQACRSPHLTAGEAPSAPAPWLTWAADCSAALLA